MARQKDFVLSKTQLLRVDGARLTEARLKAKLSIVAVSEHLGCNKGTVSRWEQDKLVPTIERMMAMAKLFGTYDFIRLNQEAILTPDLVIAVKNLSERKRSRN